MMKHSPKIIFVEIFRRKFGNRNKWNFLVQILTSKTEFVRFRCELPCLAVLNFRYSHFGEILISGSFFFINDLVVWRKSVKE